jgi:hypothetical protein
VLRDFALTPDVFDPVVLDGDPAAGRALVRLLEGMQLFGVLANMHRGAWAKHVREARASELSPSMQRDVVELLEELDRRNRIVRFPKSTGGDPTKDEDWLRIALEYNHAAPFTAVIVSELLRTAVGTTPEILELCAATASPIWKACSHDMAVRPERAEFERALRPLLRHAESVTVVDRYLSPHKQEFRTTVEMCSQFLRADTTRRIRLHARDPRDFTGTEYEAVDDRLNAWGDFLLPLAQARPRRFEVYLWGEKYGGRIWHDRYIFTEQAGVTAPGGLQCHSGPGWPASDWSLMSLALAEERLRDFDLATSPFNFVGGVEVTRHGAQRITR